MAHLRCSTGASNIPVVLVGITANRLEISIAVCIGSLYVSKLLLPFLLGFMPLTTSSASLVSSKLCHTQVGPISRTGSAVWHLLDSCRSFQNVAQARVSAVSVSRWPAHLKPQALLFMSQLSPTPARRCSPVQRKSASYTL